MKFSDNVENRWLKLLTFRIHVIFQRPRSMTKIKKPRGFDDKATYYAYVT